MPRSVSETLQGWSAQDYANLAVLLEINEPSTQDQILERMKWLFHSKTAAASDATARNFISILSHKVFGKPYSAVSRDDVREMPSYEDLIVSACRHLKVFDKTASIDQLELYMSQAVVISALAAMGPRERSMFFETPIDLATLASASNVQNGELRAPLTNLALLGAAQASGFAVYAASTTALGFLTHAVGISLPFAAFTGMTSTIAFIIGPPGWLAASAWLAWKYMQPNWKKLLRALMYIVVTNNRRRLGVPS